MSANIGDLNDQDLWVEFMKEDRAIAEGTDTFLRMSSLQAEIARRFGPEATERTATWAVRNHASSDDLVHWAMYDFDNLLQVARGEYPPAK